jgi:hypothetical protein
MVFKCQLKDVYCWEKGQAYATFIQETAPFEFGDLASLAKGETCRIVQNGPYRIKICIESPGAGAAGAKLMAGSTVLGELSNFDGHGEVFVFMPVVEKIDTAKGTVLGSAEGCFKIIW